MRTGTVTRVVASTPKHVNERILRATERNVAGYTDAGADAIAHRLAELDREWDLDRVTWLSASIDAFLTLGLGLWRGRRWFVGGLVFLGGAMLMHTAVGQCPSLPLYRRLGYRTRTEIDYERYALKALRGDFGAGGGDTHRVFEAVRA